VNSRSPRRAALSLWTQRPLPTGFVLANRTPHTRCNRLGSWLRAMSATRSRLLARDEPVRLETPSTRATGFLHAGTYERRRAGHSGAAPSHGPAVSAPEWNDRRRTILNQGRRAASPYRPPPLGRIGISPPRPRRRVRGKRMPCIALRCRTRGRGFQLLGRSWNNIAASQEPTMPEMAVRRRSSGLRGTPTVRAAIPSGERSPRPLRRLAWWCERGERSTRTPRSCKPAGRHRACNW
jgi:hypothetical protein